ncbi:MAG TPA: DUF5335 family protein [Vicinamibacterales bacterium]|nr:DUF5335 family protein [Vicinamibacterales bacterium]
MQTSEVPRSEWERRLEEFSAAHDGWLVSMEVMGSDIGAQPEVQHMPLLGLSAENHEGDGTIVVSVAKSASDHLTHLIHNATHLYLQEEPGAAVEIESADGLKSVLRFDQPASRKL